MTPGETALNLRKFQKSRKEGLKEPAAGERCYAFIILDQGKLHNNHAKWNVHSQ